MRGTSKTPPKYRKHKVSCQAIVTIGGKDHYLGPHGSKVSRAEYDRVVGEWLANGRRIQPQTGPGQFGGESVRIFAELKFIDSNSLDVTPFISPYRTRD